MARLSDSAAPRLYVLADNPPLLAERLVHEGVFVPSDAPLDVGDIANLAIVNVKPSPTQVPVLIVGRRFQGACSASLVPGLKVRALDPMHPGLTRLTLACP